MKYATLIVAVAVLGFSSQTLAFGEEPSIASGTTAAAPKAKEPTLLDKVAKYEKGKTTLADVVKELGQPSRITEMPDNTKHVQYATFGYFSTSYSAVLIFDDKDVLKAKMTSQQ
jgi:hypothetical protein